MDAEEADHCAAQQAWALARPLVDAFTLVRWELKHDVLAVARVTALIQQGVAGPVPEPMADLVVVLERTVAHMRWALDAVALPAILQAQTVRRGELGGTGDGI